MSVNTVHSPAPRVGRKVLAVLVIASLELIVTGVWYHLHVQSYGGLSAATDAHPFALKHLFGMQATTAITTWFTIVHGGRNLARFRRR